MIEASGAKDQFLASLDRCLDSEMFVRSFYERFMSTSDSVARRFLHTDFERQNRMLARSLRLVAEATSGEQAGLQELRERAETHDRQHLDINPELYSFWRTAVIGTAREFDVHWNDELEASWCQILDYAISYMVRRY